jgi:hypothetical protein
MVAQHQTIECLLLLLLRSLLLLLSLSGAQVLFGGCVCFVLYRVCFFCATALHAGIHYIVASWCFCCCFVLPCCHTPVQVCWEKFCRYWDVAEAYVPVEEGRYGITPQLAREMIDENTIGARGCSCGCGCGRGTSVV